jgi:hypothetical protein
MRWIIAITVLALIIASANNAGQSETEKIRQDYEAKQALVDRNVGRAGL